MAARRGKRPPADAAPARPPDEVEPVATELYALPPEEFVKARDAKARDLRKAGKRDEAEAVRKLRKPTLAAWAVNQLARERELDVRRLLKAGERLREGQPDDAGFLEARQEESAVIRRLLGAARDLLEKSGHPASDSTLEGVASILRSAAVDEQGREELAQRRITREYEPGGFELFSALLESARPGPRRGGTKRAPAPDRAAARRRRRAAEQKAAEAEAEADGLERELVRHEQRITDIERELRDAERQAKALRTKVKRARDRAERTRKQADSLKGAS
ncbi:MAG TPA: hypothetical protein VFL41_10585 [Gaiellaceae bacterium]|nr:hypothetical protein [Gaiellaceae bacterium]